MVKKFVHYRYLKSLTPTVYKAIGVILAKLRVAKSKGKGVRLTAKEVKDLFLEVLEKEYENFTEEDSPKGEYVMGTGGWLTWLNGLGVGAST